MGVLFENREKAGQQLAERLAEWFKAEDLVVLGLPRGGLPVAAPVAARLEAPLDVLVVRKLGFPGQEELAMGAIASGGARVMNEDMAGLKSVDEAAMQEVVDRETAELKRREERYRGKRPFPETAGRTVILVDDGIATGATMEAAVRAVRQYEPARVVVAVPLAPPDSAERLRLVADETVCLEQPEPFGGVGAWYRHFGQTTDDEVRDILRRFHAAGEK